MLRLSLAVLVVWPAVVFAAPDYAPLDQLFAQRDQPGMTEKLDAALDQALKAAPQDYGLLWRKARIGHWKADGATDSEQKKLLGKECWATADVALALQPAGIEANYFGAACIGAYSQAVGILKALGEGLEGKFNDRLDKALSIDPKFEHCAPLLAKGRYYYELPWPKRNLDKSAELYQKAEKLCPEALRAPLWLAETELKRNGVTPALVALQPAINGKVDYDPAEGKRVKGWIPKVQKEIQEESK